jgi:gas vesicle protein
MTDEKLQQEGQGFVVGAVVGALAGSIAAMLLTPKNGKEMRRVVLEYAKEWEGEAGDFGEEARHILNSIKNALDEGADQVLTQAPHVASQASHVASQAVNTVEEGYANSRDSVSEMVEAFRSQWQELEEENQTQTPAATLHQNSRFRGVSRTWETQPATDEQKENQVYVEELQEEVEPTTTHTTRPTLAQYRQSAAREAKAELKQSVEKVEAVKAANTDEKPAKKTGGRRKLLFSKKA